MKSKLKHFLGILLILIIIGCGQDESESNIRLKQEIPKIKLRDNNSSNNVLYQDLPKSPDKETLNELHNALTQTNEWEEVNNAIVQNNCTIRWNWSTLDKMDGSDYSITVPITNENNAICIYVMYTMMNENAQFNIMTMKELKEVTKNFTSIEVDSRYVPYIVKTIMYDHYAYQKKDTKLAMWFQNYFAANPDQIDS